jgi:rod shape-determining protein MreC
VWGFLNRFKTIIVLVIFLFLPIVFFYVQRRMPSVKATMASVILDVSQLVQNGLLGMTNRLGEFYSRYLASVDSYDEIIYLRGRVRGIQALRIALTESELENQRLRKLLQFSESIEGPRIIGAGVIGRTGSPLSRTIQINRGSLAGIHRGDAVISDSGAVGLVLANGKYASEVLLMTDVASAIDVIVERSRAHGIVRGMSDGKRYALRVRDFDRLHDVKEGDIIVTSGVGARFPMGIPVGKVISVRFNHEGLYTEADIEPYTKFDRIEEVLILNRSNSNKPWHRKEMVMQQLQQSISDETKQEK